MAQKEWCDISTKEERRRLIRALRTTADEMGTQELTALLMFAQELDQPGSVYRAVYDSGTSRVAEQLSLT